MKTKIPDFDSVRDVPKRFCLLLQFQVVHICWWFLNLNCWPSPFLLATGICLASLASLPGTSHSGCQKTSYFLSPKACCLLLLLYHLFSLLLVASSHQPFGFQLDAGDCPGLLSSSSSSPGPHPVSLSPPSFASWWNKFSDCGPFASHPNFCTCIFPNWSP